MTYNERTIFLALVWYAAFFDLFLLFDEVKGNDLKHVSAAFKSLSHFACLCKEETVLAFFVFLEEKKKLDPTADSRYFQEKFELISLKQYIFGGGRGESLLPCQIAVCQAGYMEVYFEKKLGLLLPTLIVFLLHAFRSRPALDNFRKRVGLHVNWLNNSKSICALKYFACFLSLIVFLVSFLNLS